MPPFALSGKRGSMGLRISSDPEIFFSELAIFAVIIGLRAFQGAVFAIAKALKI